LIPRDDGTHRRRGRRADAQRVLQRRSGPPASAASSTVVNAAGVFFHLEELHSVTDGIRESLAEDGLFVVHSST